MQLQGKAVRVTIYIGESDHYKGQPLYLALLEMLKREGASGGTVTRGLAGFGAHSRIHTATIVSLSEDLPIKVEWVDPAARVERLLPEVRRMVEDGLIVLEEVEVIQYAAGRQADLLSQPVRDIMRHEVVSVGPDMAVAKIVDMLLQQGYRSLPVVVDDGHLVGMITDGDLLRRAGLAARLDLQEVLPTGQLQQQLVALRERGEKATDIMTQPVTTVRADAPIRQAAALMVDRGLKRLPVVGDDERLVGWVSRVDLFRAVEYHQPALETRAETAPGGRTIPLLMYKKVAAVTSDTPLEKIMQALEARRQRRVVVIDADRRVLGIITDGDLLRRSRRGRHPGLLDRLRSLVTGQADETAFTLPPANETAADLMSAPAITINLTSGIDEALRLMLQHKIKCLPVVDEDGRLVGLLGRASLLNGLLAEPALE